MPFSPINVVNGSTPANATWGNNVQTQYTESTLSFNPDLFAPFVLSGLVASRHNSYSSNVLALSPLRYYRLDDAAGNSAVDSSSSALAGSYVNNPTLGVAGGLTGDPDTAITLTAASSQRISVPNNGLPTGNAAMSLGVLFKISALPAALQFLWGYGNTGTNHQALQVSVTTAGKLQGDFGNLSTPITGATTISLNAWHHAVMTWDGTTATLYLDGASQGSSTPGAQAIPAGPTINIGATSTPSNFFNGSIDEAFITGAALTGAQVSTLYTAGTTATTQVDVTSGVIYPKQSDNTTRRQAIASANYTTVTISTTYYLDANPDGTTSWGTSHSAQANYLPVAQVTTDSSGNVSAITDMRTLTTTLLPMATTAGVPMIMAKALRTVVPGTNTVTVLNYNIPANGLYRISGSVFINNGTAANKPNFHYSFTGVVASPQQINYFYSMGSGSIGLMDGTSTSFAAGYGEVALAPQTVQMNVGALAVSYVSTGTPNDTVSVMVERLA